MGRAERPKIAKCIHRSHNLELAGPCPRIFIDQGSACAVLTSDTYSVRRQKTAWQNRQGSPLPAATSSLFSLGLQPQDDAKGACFMCLGRFLSTLSSARRQNLPLRCTGFETEPLSDIPDLSPLKAEAPVGDCPKRR